eukprot:TRINITY_DN37003_c1_g1_i1.p1 TRINITY_DN37003_c1_g1~~TRINITY_DN37003_c1_g1_i1.p1  ORF type:complete len:365 (+),score=-12.64 TRINITY_DN37003_c1_g1_i1:147-1241(+)
MRALLPKKICICRHFWGIFKRYLRKYFPNKEVWYKKLKFQFGALAHLKNKKIKSNLNITSPWNFWRVPPKIFKCTVIMVCLFNTSVLSSKFGPNYSVKFFRNQFMYILHVCTNERESKRERERVRQLFYKHCFTCLFLELICSQSLFIIYLCFKQFYLCYLRNFLVYQIICVMDNIKYREMLHRYRFFWIFDAQKKPLRYTFVLQSPNNLIKIVSQVFFRFYYVGDVIEPYIYVGFNICGVIYIRARTKNVYEIAFLQSGIFALILNAFIQTQFMDTLSATYTQVILTHNLGSDHFPIQSLGNICIGFARFFKRNSRFLIDKFSVQEFFVYIFVFNIQNIIIIMFLQLFLFDDQTSVYQGRYKK